MTRLLCRIYFHTKWKLDFQHILFYFVLCKDLELNEDDAAGGSSSQSVRKNISLKLKAGKGRGRPRKAASPRSKRSSGRKREERDLEEDKPGV